MPLQTKKVASVREAADQLGVSLSTMYEVLRRGDVPSIRLGRRWLIPQQGIDAMLAAAMRPTPPQQQPAA